MAYNEQYKTFISYVMEMKHLDSILQQLNWDREVCLPQKGGAFFTKKRVYLETLLHEKKTNPFFEELVRSLHVRKEEAASPLQADVITIALQDIEKAKKLPETFVIAFSEATSHALNCWEEARRTARWSLFSKPFDRIVDLLREKADLQLEEGMNNRYDALLDEYEKGLRSHDVENLLSPLAHKLPLLFEEITKESDWTQEPVPFYATPDQEFELCSHALSTIGLPSDSYRLDRSFHPMSFGLSPNDLRVTIRKERSPLLSQISAALHEGGHALYEHGLDSEWYGTAKGEAASFGIHESQSRFFELCVGGSASFLEFLLPTMHTVAPLTQAAFPSSAQLYSSYNRLKPTLFRIESSEIQYPLHVYIRYVIEQELLHKKLSVDEVPARWNGLMQQYIGLTPSNDADGCLQDIHWSLGSFGYFPTYVFGTAWCFGIQTAMETEWNLSLDALIKQREFFRINEWLSRHIWSQGRIHTGPELMKGLLKDRLLADTYMHHVEQKYRKNR